MLDPQKDFQGIMARDLFGLVAGNEIGSGIARRVYVYDPSPNMVIKFESESQSFQNIIEWEIWLSIQGSKYAKWFAPCYNISPCGTALIQKRTEKIGRKEYPTKMPIFFSDFKYANFGLSEDKFVCHDYGYPNFLIKSLSNRMKKVEWWGDY